MQMTDDFFISLIKIARESVSRRKRFKQQKMESKILSLDSAEQSVAPRRSTLFLAPPRVGSTILAEPNTELLVPQAREIEIAPSPPPPPEAAVDPLAVDTTVEDIQQRAGKTVSLEVEEPIGDSSSK